MLKLLPGIGPSAAGSILDTITSSLDTVLGLSAVRPPQRSEADWPAFVDLFAGLRTKSTWPSDLEWVRRWYEPHLARIHEDVVVRRADLMQLEQIAAGYPSRQRFQTDLTLDPPDATSDRAGAPHLDEDYLILSTIHSAKGQEWKSVFVLNVVDGCIPIDLATGEDADIEEERRLLYVAMTRAKDSLHFLTPQRFYVTGQASRCDRHLYASRTRLIAEHVLENFEMTGWPISCPDSIEQSTGRRSASILGTGCVGCGPDCVAPTRPTTLQTYAFDRSAGGGWRWCLRQHIGAERGRSGLV